MQQLRDRWKLRVRMLLLLALYLALANIHTGTTSRLPLQQGTIAQAQAVSRHANTPGGSSQLHQVTMHITGMS